GPAAEDKETVRPGERETSIGNGAGCLPISISPGTTTPLVEQAASPGKPRQPQPQASPAVRRRARELHVDLQNVHGTGPNGRITHTDVDVHLRSEVSPSGPRRTVGSHTTE